MVVRSSLHRTKYSRGRPNAKKPDVQRELPPELRTQQLLTFDQANYDLRGRVCELLRTVPSVGASGDRLEDFAMAPDAWASKDLQCQLTEAVLADDAFLGEYDRFVREVCAVHIKKRLVECGFCELEVPLKFYYQRPPTLRLQPGPSERHVARHDDAKYGHQAGEVNFWLPLTSLAETRTTLWVESAPGADDFKPLEADLGRCGVFHGTLCRHYVPPNASSKTRVSLDFRIGVEGCFDPRWVLRGTLDDHHRREIVL